MIYVRRRSSQVLANAVQIARRSKKTKTAEMIYVTDISKPFELVALLVCIAPRGDALARYPLPGLKLQVLKLSLLSMGFSGDGGACRPAHVLQTVLMSCL
jgi:hypothetical protein